MGRLQSKGSPNCALPPTVIASAMLHAGGPHPPTRGGPPQWANRRASRSHTPIPSPVPALLPSKPKALRSPEAVLESSSAAPSSRSAGPAPLPAADTSPPGIHSVTQPGTVYASSDSMPAAFPSRPSTEVLPEVSSSASGQSSVPETETVHGSLHKPAADHFVGGPDPALIGNHPLHKQQQQQQQQQPQGRSQLERVVTEPAAVQACSGHDAAAQASRPSTSGSKLGTTTSSFDRRLALLHKGLPTHLPLPSAATPRPSSRSRRGSAPSPPAGPPTHHLSAELRGPTSLLGSHLVPTESIAAVATAQQGGGAGSRTHTHLPSSEGAALHSSSSQHATSVLTPTATAEQAGLGKGAILNKPSSPTSVLPSQGLGDTTYHSFHGLADAYPELYKAAAAAGRAQKANSRALQCFVGETLKGNPDLWRQQLKSAYTMCNDRLKHDAVGKRKPCPLLCFSQ